MTEKQFPEGIIIKAVETKYGEMLKLSFKVDEAIKYLQEKSNNGWVNIDVKRAKQGNKPYLELNSYVKPAETVSDTTAPNCASEMFDDEIPF